MATGWIGQIAEVLEQKRQYRRYRARIKRLPANYRTVAEALDRYMMYAGGIAKSDVAIRMLGDLVELLEESAATRTSIRDILGDDPVAFAETFIANYADGQWINKERARLISAINRAAGETPAPGET
jgi:DNA-binding ferritin-like protein (Dps family)